MLRREDPLRRARTRPRRRILRVRGPRARHVLGASDPGDAEGGRGEARGAGARARGVQPVYQPWLAGSAGYRAPDR